MKTHLTLNDHSKIMVLDKGFVQLVSHMDDDLAVVNAARVSLEKESAELNTSDGRLINYLVREGHFSTLRHSFVKFRVRAPLMVARQHFKYVVGSSFSDSFGWNEASRRYVTEKEEFYTPKPDEWRSAPENMKQGSGAVVPLDVGSEAYQMLMEDVDRQLAHYKWALDSGICAEQARLFLPAYGLYVSYIWSCSLQALTHFLAQRLEDDAQKEIRDYAHAVKVLTAPLYPVTFQAYGLI